MHAEKLTSILASELERQAQGRWSLAPGKRHWRLLIDGHQVTVLTRSTKPGHVRARRSELNQRAQVRRYLSAHPYP